jgi:hypothetical protein
MTAVHARRGRRGLLNHSFKHGRHCRPEDDPLEANLAKPTPSARSRASRAWWAVVRDEHGNQSDPIAHAPWDLLVREAQFGVTRAGDWLVHVPSMALIVWPDNRTFRAETLARHAAALRRFQDAGDEFSRRRAFKSLRAAQKALGVLRALEVFSTIVPRGITVEIDAPAGYGRPRCWRHARLAPTARPAMTEV